MYNRSESTTVSTTIPNDETKSTLAQDDLNHSIQCTKVKNTAKISSSPDSLVSSQPSDIAITPTTNANKMYRCRFKAKSENHAKYELFVYACNFIVVNTHHTNTHTHTQAHIAHIVVGSEEEYTGRAADIQLVILIN